jgi:hypothetical protein
MFGGEIMKNFTKNEAIDLLKESYNVLDFLSKKYSSGNAMFLKNRIWMFLNKIDLMKILNGKQWSKKEVEILMTGRRKKFILNIIRKKIKGMK